MLRLLYLLFPLCLFLCSAPDVLATSIRPAADDSLRYLQRSLDRAEKELVRVRSDRKTAVLRAEADSLSAVFHRLLAAISVDSLTADSLSRRLSIVTERCHTLDALTDSLADHWSQRAADLLRLPFAQIDTVAVSRVRNRCRDLAPIAPQLAATADSLETLSRNTVILRRLALPTRLVTPDSLKRLGETADRLTDVHPAGRAEADTLRRHIAVYKEALTALLRFTQAVNGDGFLKTLRGVNDYAGFHKMLTELIADPENPLSEAYAACRRATDPVPALRRALSDYLTETARGFPTPTEQLLTPTGGK